MDNVLDLKCHSGKLQNIKYFGFTKLDEASCIDIASSKKPEVYFQK